MSKLSYLLLLAIASPHHGSSAEQFVRQLYAPYLVHQKNGTYSPFTSRDEGRRIFSNSIVKLVDEDNQRTPAGDEGAVEADPFCQCQDYEGMKLDQIKQTVETPSRASFEISLRFAGAPPILKKLRLMLVRQQNGWRIDDVIPAEGDSLRELLTPRPRKR